MIDKVLTKSLKSAVVSLAWLTIFWSAVGPFSAAAAGPQCLDIFSTSQAIGEFNRKVKDVASPYEYFAGKTLIQVRQRYAALINKLIGSAHTADELRVALLELQKVGKLNDAYLQALRSVDLLAPLRSGAVSMKDGETIYDILEALTMADGSWAPTLEAFVYMRSPKDFQIQLKEWIGGDAPLGADFLWTGEFINVTLVRTLENLPASYREKALKLLRDSLNVVDSWMRLHNFDHQQQIEAKNPTRNWQMIQQVLIHRELREAVQALRDSQDKGQLDLAPLEKALQHLRRHDEPYDFKTVIAAAKTVQSQIAGVLKPGDFVEMFGSFPNLAAKLGRSDVDLIFSPKLDALYFQIRGGSMMTDSNFATPQTLSAPARQFADALLAAENSLRPLFNSTQAPGDLISGSTLIRTLHHGSWVVDETFDQSETGFSFVSPVYIRITRDGISLRIVDSFSTQADSPAPVDEFPLN